MLVGLKNTSRLCCKQIAEGLREKFKTLCFIELSQNLLQLAVATFFSQKSSKYAKLSKLSQLMLIVFFYSYLKLWFSCFQEV